MDNVTKDRKYSMSDLQLMYIKPCCRGKRQHTGNCIGCDLNMLPNKNTMSY